MKKLYTLALALVTITASAQFELNFDDYSPGSASDQIGLIILWPADGVTSAQLTDEQSFSPELSMVVRENDGTNVDDVLVQLGDATTGVWSVQWMMYVPSGKTGFWNIQQNQSADPAQWNGQFFVGATASGGTLGFITVDQDPEAQVAYPEGEWFSVTHVIDLDNGTHTVDINGELLLDNADYLNSSAEPATQLGSVNYYAIDADNRYYIDDFKLVEGNLLSTDSFETISFNVYPNPVQDKLNIQSQDVVDQVAIYNVLGKLVYQGSPNIVSPSVDMSNFNSGVYFVEVTIGNASKTVKVIK